MSTEPTNGGQADDFSQRLEALRQQAGDDPAQQAEAAAAQAAGVATGAGERVVRSGECISSIAKDSGHFWQTLWDANPQLKALGRQPNVLQPGDVVTVPPLRPKYEPGESKMRHRFVRRGEPSHLVLRVLDQDVPRANEPFKLIIDGDQEITGVTDPEGKLDIPIPGDAQKGKLIVGEPPDVLEYDLNLGGLEPVSTWKGVQTRLKNMGLSCEVTGEDDPQTLDAVNEFLASEGMPAVERLDDATRRKIEEKHGS